MTRQKKKANKAPASDSPGCCLLTFTDISVHLHLCLSADEDSAKLFTKHSVLSYWPPVGGNSIKRLQKEHLKSKKQLGRPARPHYLHLN